MGDRRPSTQSTSTIDSRALEDQCYLVLIMFLLDIPHSDSVGGWACDIVDVRPQIWHAYHTRSINWLWVKNRCPKWNAGKWTWTKTCGTLVV